MPAATTALLEDSAVNLDQWLATEVDQAFAVQEGTAFVTGDGSNKPKGFSRYDDRQCVVDLGRHRLYRGGADGAFASSDPSDALVDLV